MGDGMITLHLVVLPIGQGKMPQAMKVKERQDQLRDSSDDQTLALGSKDNDCRPAKIAEFTYLLFESQHLYLSHRSEEKYIRIIPRCSATAK
jgi:hypothetical protein